MTRAPTTSITPPSHATTTPNVVPTTTEIATTTNATLHDTLAPSSTRRPMSRPRSSLPNGAAMDGSANVRSSAIAFGSSTRNGAPAATTIHAMTIACAQGLQRVASRYATAMRGSTRAYSRSVIVLTRTYAALITSTQAWTSG